MRIVKLLERRRIKQYTSCNVALMLMRRKRRKKESSKKTKKDK